MLPRDEIRQCTEQIAILLESYGVNFQRADLDQMRFGSQRRGLVVTSWVDGLESLFGFGPFWWYIKGLAAVSFLG